LLTFTIQLTGSHNSKFCTDVVKQSLIAVSRWRFIQTPRRTRTATSRWWRITATSSKVLD
jgi:hypothetical protein